MTVTADSFRTDLPEFIDAQLYPDSAITYWLGIAGLMLTNWRRWGQGSATATSPPTTKLDFATEMFTAHNLVLERMAQASAGKGAPPGLQAGVLTSKSVGPVSASYDAQAGLELEAGHWNLTIYGTRFYRLAQMVGSGPIQVGVGPTPAFTGGAWPGPLVYPGGWGQ